MMHFLYPQHSFVMQEHLRRQTFNYPLVHQRLEGSHSSEGVPVEASLDKVDEALTLAAHQLLQRFGARYPQFPLRVGAQQERLVCFLVEKDLTSGGLIEELLRRQSSNLHDEGELLLFILAREDRVACEELDQDAAEAPHVYRWGVRYAEYDFRGTIEPRLDVGVDSLILEAT